MHLALEQLKAQWRFELIEIDIDRDPQVCQAYQARVPLLNDHKGRCLSEYYLDQETLLRYLQGA
jgi:hypothetical protein